jgi:hypothetical protein
MGKISRILNPVADEFFRSGIFRLNLFSLIFWCMVFVGPTIGFHHGAAAGRSLGAMIWTAIGLAFGFAGGCLFLALCYCTFHLLLRLGWVDHPKDRANDHAA